MARWIDSVTGRDAIVRNLYDPTLNLNGIWSGYTGEGVKTVLPHVATAKLDSRLPPGLEPDESVLPGEGGRLAAAVAELEAERDAVRGLGLL